MTKSPSAGSKHRPLKYGWENRILVLSQQAANQRPGFSGPYRLEMASSGMLIGDGKFSPASFVAVVFNPEEIGARAEVLSVEPDGLFTGRQGAQRLADQPGTPEIKDVQGVNPLFRGGEAQGSLIPEGVGEEDSHAGTISRLEMQVGGGVDFRYLHGNGGDGPGGDEDRVGGHGERYPVIGGGGAGDDDIVDGISGDGGFQPIAGRCGGVDGHQGGRVPVSTQKGHGFHHDGGGVDLHPGPSGMNPCRELLEDPIVFGALVPFAFVGPLIDIPGEVEVHESAVVPDQVPEEVSHGIFVVERFIYHAG